MAEKQSPVSRQKTVVPAPGLADAVCEVWSTLYTVNVTTAESFGTTRLSPTGSALYAVSAAESFGTT